MAATKKKKLTARRAKRKGPRYAPLGSLHTLLKKAFPDRRTEHGVFDVKWLAARLHMSHKAVYYWFGANSLPMKRAREILTIRGCTITLEDLLPFVS